MSELDFTIKSTIYGVFSGVAGLVLGLVFGALGMDRALDQVPVRAASAGTW